MESLLGVRSDSALAATGTSSCSFCFAVTGGSPAERVEAVAMGGREVGDGARLADVVGLTSVEMEWFCLSAVATAGAGFVVTVGFIWSITFAFFAATDLAWDEFAEDRVADGGTVAVRSTTDVTVERFCLSSAATVAVGLVETVGFLSSIAFSFSTCAFEVAAWGNFAEARATGVRDKVEEIDNCGEPGHDGVVIARSARLCFSMPESGSFAFIEAAGFSLCPVSFSLTAGGAGFSFGSPLAFNRAGADRGVVTGFESLGASLCAFSASLAAGVSVEGMVAGLRMLSGFVGERTSAGAAEVTVAPDTLSLSVAARLPAPDDGVGGGRSGMLSLRGCRGEVRQSRHRVGELENAPRRVEPYPGSLSLS